MKKLTLLALALSFNATATPVVSTAVTSVMNGSIDVGTFVSAAPNQNQTQTSSGGLRGSTIVTGSNIASTITGSVSSTSYGSGVTYSSFSVNNLPSSAAVQGSISTLITNHPIVTTSIVPHY